MTEPVWTVRPVDALEEGASDLGNARRLARLAGDKLRYVQAWNRWLVYDERIDLFTVMGAGLILVANLLNLRRSIPASKDSRMATSS